MGRPIPAELAGRVRLVALDVDGVLTDGGIYMGETAAGDAVELKRFDIMDGLGVKMLVWGGIEVALVSGRESPATRLRAEELGVACFQDAGAVKLPALGALMERQGLSWEEVAFVSDDLADLPVLEQVGLPVAVADAVAEVRAVARWVTSRPGGQGAVREFAEALLRARGDWNRLVAEYRAARAGEPEAISGARLSAGGGPAAGTPETGSVAGG